MGVNVAAHTCQVFLGSDPRAAVCNESSMHYVNYGKKKKKTFASGTASSVIWNHG